MDELPPPPQGKIGWPWTEGSSLRPEAIIGSQPWPRVSVITPSFNQCGFIEETIRSVLLQGYPNLEYVIVDGGSTDGSVEIIQKYSSWLAFWVSEPDRGQSDAINKGFARTTGEIVAWINSDDLLLPDALMKVGRAFWDDSSVGLVYGDYQYIDERGKLIKNWCTPEYDLGQMPLATWIAQGFVRRSALGDSPDLVRLDLHYMMDWDLFLRVALAHPGRRISDFLGQVRLHADAKTVAAREQFNLERQRIVDRLYSSPHLPPVVRRQRRAAKAMCQYALAISEFNRGNRGRAFQWLIQSFVTNPLRPFPLKRLLYLCGSCLPFQWSFHVQRRVHERLHTRSYIEALFGRQK